MYINVFILQSIVGRDVFVCPVVWGSDSTHLTFTGSKKAHNVFVSPGVLKTDRRQKMDGMKLAGQVYSRIYTHIYDVYMRLCIYLDCFRFRSLTATRPSEQPLTLLLPASICSTKQCGQFFNHWSLSHRSNVFSMHIYVYLRISTCIDITGRSVASFVRMERHATSCSRCLCTAVTGRSSVTSSVS